MSTDDAVRDVIEAQCMAWNDANIPGFISYVHEDVVYVTPNGLVQGKEKLQEAYSGDWRDKGGELSVFVEQVMDHGSSATAVVRYWLSGSSDDRSGWSLLTFVNSNGAWKLIADASMRSH
jgi:ketosteroid isomerase-like protein